MTLMLKQVKGQRFSLLWEDGEEGALAVAEETQCRASGLAGTSPVCCRLAGKMGLWSMKWGTRFQRHMRNSKNWLLEHVNTV